MKAIRTATICHSQDDYTKKGHKRVKLDLLKTDRGYEWFCDGEGTESGYYDTVREAEQAAKSAWGGEVWAFKAKWL